MYYREEILIKKKKPYTSKIEVKDRRRALIPLKAFKAACRDGNN
jgi:hypothetical protein